MKASIIIASAIIALGAAVSIQVAQADTRVIITFPAYGNNGSGSPGHNPGNGNSEYTRGYNDAVKGHPYDQDRHPQDCKVGYRAGEQDR